MKMSKILTNHIGYDPEDSKNAVLQTEESVHPVKFEVVNTKTGETAFTGKPEEVGTVAKWNTGYYYTLRFDELKETGEYFIKVYAEDAFFHSYPFQIKPNLLEMKTLSNVAYYFKAQRPTGELEAVERHLPFAVNADGTKEYAGQTRDVRGGWLDATGDYGIHLSHLTHTTYFNPQQASFSAYAFFKIAELLEESKYPYYTMLKRRMMDEGMYGADFLMRMRADSGSFYISKSRGEAFTPVGRTRHIAYQYHKAGDRLGGDVLNGFDEITRANYETSFRSGGGYAITALAAASRCNYPSEYSKESYLQAAIESYAYLEENNETYTDDGKWNLLDEYCALSALIELYRATLEYDYLRKAEAMFERIEKRYRPLDDTMGYLAVNDGDRPFFHCADAGMPVVNILEYAELESNPAWKERAVLLASRLMKHELAVTNEVNNPFGYARQRVMHGDGSVRNQFFYPHDVETAPWWQGENARIASLAAAARKLTFFTEGEFKAALAKFADDQINWVLGLNPFDSSMLSGSGRNNIDYFFKDRLDFIQCPGGISNGITGGLHDDAEGIDYILEPTDEIDDNWRWAEQWIPHGTWFMYALAAKKR